MQICIYFVLTIVMEQTGVEPVKPKSRKPLILKESSKYNTLRPHHHADNRTEKVFRVAFCTVMQHGNATRNKAAGSLLAANKKRLDFCFSHRSSRRFILIWYISTNLFYLAIQYFT